MVLNYFMTMQKENEFDPPASIDPDEPGIEAIDEPAELACTNNALRRAARRLGRLYDEALAPLELKATQFGLLVEIDGCPRKDGREGPTLQELAARLAIQISALTHALRPLVRDGLVEVRRDAHDRRTKRGVLTPLGEVRLREALPLWAAANRRVETVLGSAAAEKLRSLVDKVASQEFLDAYTARTRAEADAEASSDPG